MSNEIKIEETVIVEKPSKLDEPKEVVTQKPVNGDSQEENKKEDEVPTEPTAINDAPSENESESSKLTKENLETEKEQNEKSTNDDGDEEGDDDEEESSDEDLPPGLLERPVEILKDKRQRKKTTRFTYDDVPTPSSEKKKVEIPEGRGVRLGDQPRVEWQLNRNKVEDLKIIHKLFFGVFGDAFSCKKNMRNFTGFPFEKDSPEYEKKEDYIGRFTLDNLKWALTVCDIENKKGKKEDLIDHFLDWCLCPKPSGKDVPKKKSKKDKSQKKKKSLNNKSNTSITSDDLSDDDEEDTGSKKTNPKKSKPTKKTPQKKQTPKSTPKSSAKKRSAPSSGKKLAKVKIGSPKKSDDGRDSDDSDTPLQKKSKKPPTNGQIRKDVANILKGADLEVITMKAVCMKVYQLYPDFDISDKKPFIKETVKSIIS